ncbi:MAG: hypothetical protein ATN31_09760 [Candidatus Epulonipiscioides saccharophilum]|nr:MAG: hypothetical protein ATN31_09760 [Epulopiscium sp. AS2M-Bin001]
MNNDELLLVLLTGCFKISNSRIKPLTLNELSDFMSRIKLKKISAESIINKNGLKRLGLTPQTYERLRMLIDKDRKAKIIGELKILEKNGIKIITKINKKYPKLLNEKLNDSAPPLFYYCGNIDLVNEPGIAMVGLSRTTLKTIDDAIDIAQSMVKQNYIIYSTGSKGADLAATDAAYYAGGSYVVIISNMFEIQEITPALRERLASGRVLFISTVNPMIKNFSLESKNAKYLHAISQAVIVANSDMNDKGPWSGVTENIKNKWTPILVMDSSNTGNQALMKLGIQTINPKFPTIQPLNQLI